MRHFHLPTLHPTLLVAFALAITLLTGCGDSTIKTVQNATLPDDSQITIGKVLKDRKVCDKNNWEAHEDSRGQKLVSYKCHFSAKELNLEQEDKRKDFIATLTNLMDTELAKRKKHVVQVKFDTANRILQIEGQIEELDNAMQKIENNIKLIPADKIFDPKTLEETPYFIKMRTLITKLDANIGQPYDEPQALALLLSDEFNSTEFEQTRKQANTDILHTRVTSTLLYHRNNREKMAREIKTAPSERRYTYRNFSKRLNEFHANLSEIKNAILWVLERHVNIEKQKIHRENDAAKRRVTSLQGELERMKANKTKVFERIAAYKSDVERAEKSYAELEKEKNDPNFKKDMEQQAQQKYPDYSAVFEGFAWEVDRQGRPSLKEGGLIYQSKEYGDDFRRYTNPADILNRISKFDAKNFKDYRQSLGRPFGW